MKRQSAKKLPVLLSDGEAESFVATADLSEYDLSGGIPLGQLEYLAKSASVHMRLPQKQLDQIKAEAQRRGVPYQRFMRELMQRGLGTLTHS